MGASCYQHLSNFQNTEYWRRRSNFVLPYDWGGVRRKVGIGPRICSWHPAAAKESGRWLGATKIALGRQQHPWSIARIPAYHQQYSTPQILWNSATATSIATNTVGDTCEGVSNCSWYALENIGNYGVFWIILEYTQYTNKILYWIILEDTNKIFQNTWWRIQPPPLPSRPGEEPTAKNLYADAVKL